MVAKRVVKKSVAIKGSSALKAKLTKEVGNSKKSLAVLKISQRKLKLEERTLAKKEAELFKKVKKVEKQIVSEEQRYSMLMTLQSVAGKPKVSLSDKEIKHLQKLSGDYNAFREYMVTGLKGKAEEFIKAYGGECAWSACWTCTSDCGAACSDICRNFCGAHGSGN